MKQMCPRIRTGRVIIGGRRNFDDLCAHTRQIDGRAVVEPFHFAQEFYNQILPLVERRLQACSGRVAYVLLQWRLVNTVRGPA